MSTRPLNDAWFEKVSGSMYRLIERVRNEYADTSY